MEFMSLDELREVDERALAFSPFGLGGRMDAPDAVRFQQDVVSHPELAPDLPQRVRDGFDRLRRTHAYGVLFYDFFTVAHDQARLFLEFALRERFVEFHGGAAQFRDRAGELHDVPTAPFKELQAGARRHDGEDDEWRLVVCGTGRDIRFDGMLDSLLRWAHEEGLLPGQRNRARDRLITGGRNHIAHGAGDHLLTPVESARVISDTAEIVNRLWGEPTPAGRLYPAPIRREVQLVGWSPSEVVMAGQVAVPDDGLPVDWEGAVSQIQSALPESSPVDAWTWVLVRAVPNDEGLMRFDSMFEVTTYPCDLLWGPGTAAEMVAWVEHESPQGDAVDVLDRLFLVQHVGDRVYLPRHPEIALGLADSERAGTWSLVRADDPEEAFRHVRNVAGGGGCSRRGQCAQCAVQTVRRGAWKDVASVLAAECPGCRPRQVPDVRVSSGLRWPRYHQILDDGNWSLGDR